MTLRDKAERFAAAHGMLPEGTRVLCACSGGADSVCLLHLLHETPGLSVVCAHFNHLLRGAESDWDEAFVRALCAQLGVTCVTGRGDAGAYAAAHGLGIEEAARALRYDFLLRTAQAYGCTRIATAHNAGDNAETVLLNLIRGSGTKGLCGIPPVRGEIVRPLLTVTREEILDYLRAHGLSHVEDSSNESDEYARNRIRHQVLPLLRELNSGAAENIGAAAALLRQDEEYLSAQAEAFLQTNGGDGGVSAPALLALPRPVGARVLRTLCPGAQRHHVEAILALCGSGKLRGETDVPGARVVLERGVLRVNPPEVLPLPRRELVLGGETAFPEAKLQICCRLVPEAKEIHNSFNTFYFKSERICGRMYAASRGAGDSVRLLGRGCTKSLKKLYSEAGLTAEERLLTPVLYDEAGVIAVPGFGIAERCAAMPGEPAVCAEIIETPERFTLWQEK